MNKYMEFRTIEPYGHIKYVTINLEGISHAYKRNINHTSIYMLNGAVFVVDKEYTSILEILGGF